MQENEFEKDMRQKMEALQLQPAEEVWQKIKAEVSQKRKHRRGLVFFLIAAGLFVAGILFINTSGVFNKQDKDAIAENKISAVTGQEQKDKKDSGAVNNNNATLATAGETVNNKEENAIPSNEPLNEVSNNSKAAVVVSKANAQEIYPGSDEKIKKPGVLKRKTKPSIKATIVSATPSEDKEENITETEPILLKENVNTAVVINDNNKNEEKKEAVDEVNNDAVIKTETKPADEKKKETKNENKSAKQKWGVGFSIAGGKSYAGYNNTSKNLLYSSDGATATPGNNTGNPPVTYYPSEASPSFGFTAGLQLFRPLSKKVKFITGLQYQLYSTSQKTGIASGATQSFAGREKRFAYGTQYNYRNSYHYLTLPVGVSAHLFNIGNKEINGEVGINFTRMLKTNALLFDTAGGYYYTQPASFNKNFIGLSAAFSINLFGKNKPGLYIGPQFYYSFTALSPDGMYGSTHSRFIGLRLQKNLTK